jgi:hypothetical protein
VAGESRPKRDRGSRSIFGVLRHPFAAFFAPYRDGADPAEVDRCAVWGPEGRLITCFVMASFDPLPRRWKQGGLHLDETGARWSAGFWPRGGGEPLPSEVDVKLVREVTGVREGLHVKKGYFQVIEARTDRGDLYLAVPRDSVALVVERLSLDGRV